MCGGSEGRGAVASLKKWKRRAAHRGVEKAGKNRRANCRKNIEKRVMGIRRSTYPLERRMDKARPTPPLPHKSRPGPPLLILRFLPDRLAAQRVFRAYTRPPRRL